MEARLDRLRAVIQSDLEKLPDIPAPAPKAGPKLEVKAAAAPAFIVSPRPEVKSKPKPALIPNAGNIFWPEAQQYDDSDDDSEADYDMEFIRVEEDEGRIKELEKYNPCDEHVPAVVSTIKKGSLAKGQLVPQGQGFAAIIGFSKFPYKYLPKDQSENVADRFFNSGKFFMREWDLYVLPFFFFRV